MNISISEARTKFSELVRRAEAGEEIVITRRGKPVARILPPLTNERDNQSVASKRGRPSLLGAMKGQIWIAPDFDELGPEWDEYTK